MSEAKVIERVSEAAVLLKPLRLEIMHLLKRPRTCGDLADALGISVQKANYHVKVLREAGLVAQVARRQVRGTVQGIYRAVADSIQLAPGLVDTRLGPAILSMDTTVRLPVGASQPAFMTELEAALKSIAAKYGTQGDITAEGEAFRLVARCYAPSGAGE